MTTTQEWIDWSTAFARPYWSRSHQLFLEVAMAATRWPRDNVPGMSTLDELACAEHYWYARWATFMVGGAAGDVVATPVSIGSDSAADLFGQLAAYGGGAAGGLMMFLFAGAWDALKSVAFLVGAPELIPGGNAPASRPSWAQIGWAARGVADGLARSVPYAEDMRWRAVINDLPGTLTLPPLPAGA